ncbi:uncharacterized protein BX664DRAFT_358166 [Halteromyces radiatus]|uniref:uncharacterized protein n=1 Tax=Halteromyces radiatus TaxID=101107 RepID=UPI0022202752|nr:uncharacterized protein BX664DRAFT_358166 [Halteromyces radiatus]KAI8093768.1 hypothetical protein BX664DRAFT_358166 [Halteromyces radiatus]
MEEYMTTLSPRKVEQNNNIISSKTNVSPFLDACRTAHENATKEFDQFYGYISKVMTPRRSQQQQNNRINKIHKKTPRITSRIKQELEQRHNTTKNSSSLTPLMERQSLATQPITFMHDTPNTSNRYITSPTTYRHRRQQDYPPPRPMTLTPETIRTSSTNNNNLILDADNDMEEDRYQGRRNTYIHSPHRTAPSSSRSSTTPSRLFNYSSIINNEDIVASCPSSPSVVLHDQLLDESRRLELLQQKVLLVQQQSSLLANFTTTTTTTNVSPSYERTALFKNKSLDQLDEPITTSVPSTHSSQYANPSRSSATKYYPTPTSSLTQTTNVPKQSLSSIPSPPPPPPPVFTTSTPLTVPISSFPSDQNPRHPVFSAPSAKLASYSTSLSTPIPSNRSSIHHTSKTEPGLIPSSSPLGQQKQTMTNVLSDIPKAKLRSAETITTPNGSRIKNKFWSEIHGSKNDTSSSFDASQRKRKNLEDEELFWMNKDDQPKESQWKDRLEKVKTLDQELYQANDKYTQWQQDEQQRHIQSRAFSLQHKPHPSDLFEELSHTLNQQAKKNQHNNEGQQRMIDGDEWTFGGQHYSVQERK